jgi:hypothetical protein
MPKWGFLLPLLVLGTFGVVLLARFFTKGDLYLAYFEDDYYYYLIVARNLVLHGLSSFDGVRPTNGYQPLWQVVNITLYWMFGSTRTFFVVLALLVFLLVCATYRVMRQTQSIMGITDGYGLACALLSITFMASISRTGMEVSLTLFLLMLFWKRMAAQPLEDQTAGAAVLSGLLASGVVLGRLDSLMVVGLYGLLTLQRSRRTRSETVRTLAYFTLGLLPVVAYFAFNHHNFGTVLPISGVAKNLKTDLSPSSSTLNSLLRVRGVNVLLTWPSCILGLLFAFTRNQRPTSPKPFDLTGRRVELCVLLHPIFFYSILSFTSDWQIWSWYLYPLVPVGALLGPTVVFESWKRLRPQIAIQRLTIAAACLSFLTLIGMLQDNPTELLLYQQAQQLEAFAKTHPGRYAMGGGAGVPGYVMTSNLVQVEGLMTDAAFLQRIRNKEPLIQVLNDLGVDYYATMLLRGPQPGPCYHVREPEMAGYRSPVMAGDFCAPVADFENPGGNHLLIFDVHQLTPTEEDPDREGQ